MKYDESCFNALQVCEVQLRNSDRLVNILDDKSEEHKAKIKELEAKVERLAKENKKLKTDYERWILRNEG